MKKKETSPILKFLDLLSKLTRPRGKCSYELVDAARKAKKK